MPSRDDSFYIMNRCIVFQGVVVLGLLVQSAFQTGCLSVASEGLIRQLLTDAVASPNELEAVVALERALQAGQLDRESAKPLRLLTANALVQTQSVSPMAAVGGR